MIKNNIRKECQFMTLLNKLSVQNIKTLTIENGELILKEKNLSPLDILSLREQGIMVARQFCEELGEIGYKTFAS